MGTARAADGDLAADRRPALGAIELGEVLAVAERQRGAGALFGTVALVVALRGGATLQWEHLTNHQIAPAAAAIESALDATG